jgi:hypothetical protein
MSHTSLVRQLATTVGAIANCKAEPQRYGNWLATHTDRAKSLVRNHMPSGSGLDNGVSIDLSTSSPERLVFHTSFHHMNDTGMYDGWTEHTVTVRASLQFGLLINISGPNRNEVKDDIRERFDMALRAEVK